MKHFYCLKYQNLKIHTIKEKWNPDNPDHCYLYDAYCYEDPKTEQLLLGSFTNKNIDEIVINFCPFCGYKAVKQSTFDCEQLKE